MSAKTLARRERPWRGADDPGEGCLPPLAQLYIRKSEVVALLYLKIIQADLPLTVHEQCCRFTAR